MDGIAGRIEDGAHLLPVRVYFEDTDFSGRVYHARYLQFMERGRSDYLRLLGIHHHALAEEGRAFAVRHMAIDFLKPATIDDILTVRTTPSEVRGARIVLRQEVLGEAGILVAASVTVALIGADGRAARLPPEIREALGGGAGSAASGSAA